MHHFNGTTRKSKSHRPHRSLSSPVHNLIYEFKIWGGSSTASADVNT
jgi:hypothetical protein